MGWSIEDGGRRSWYNKIWKVYRQIELQQITLAVVVCCAVGNLLQSLVYLKRVGFYSRDDIEVRNRLSYKPRLDSILMCCACLWDRRSAPMSSSWKHEKSIWAERRFPSPTLLHYSLYRTEVLILSQMVCLWAPFTFLARETASSWHYPKSYTTLTLLSRWKLGECHKD